MLAPTADGEDTAGSNSDFLKSVFYSGGWLAARDDLLPFLRYSSRREPPSARPDMGYSDKGLVTRLFVRCSYCAGLLRCW
jgi:hypothetical protein